LKIIQRNKYGGGGGASFHELKEKDGVTKIFDSKSKRS